MNNPDEPRTLSDARIDANRANAKKSTGPTSAAGKATSSRNRLTHGMRANKHILLDGDNPEDFLLLLKSLDDTFRPVGEAEEMLVTRIAADQWRVDRSLAMEEGIYRERLVGVAATDYSRKLGLINHKKNHERDPERFSPAPAPPDPDDRLARAFILDCEKSNSIANCNRYKASTQLSIDRNIRQLKIYQAARIANTPAPGHQPSPPPDQTARPETGPQDDAQIVAPPAVTPQESANYHSNPTNGDTAKFGAPFWSPGVLLLLSTLLQAVPDLIAAVASLLNGQQTGHNRPKINVFQPLAPAANSRVPPPARQIFPGGSHAIRAC